MPHVHEARMLCQKTVELFTYLSRTQDMLQIDQELVAPVTGIAHYLKILVHVALTGALALEREQSIREAMPSFLDKLHLLAVQGGDPAARRLIKSGSDQIVGQHKEVNIGNRVSHTVSSAWPQKMQESHHSLQICHLA